MARLILASPRERLSPAHSTTSTVRLSRGSTQQAMRRCTAPRLRGSGAAKEGVDRLAPHRMCGAATEDTLAAAQRQRECGRAAAPPPRLSPCRSLWSE
eukprot:scaffold30643_cov35-Tisochrysis_lutea.AAC.1